MLCGISPAFAGLSPTEGKVAHVLRTRSPRARLLYCYRRLRVRLACVKHAASVRSEPGSNSRLNPVLLEIPKNNKKRTFDRSVSQKTERVLACFVRLSKSRTSCPAGRSTDKRKLYRKGRGVSTHFGGEESGRGESTRPGWRRPRGLRVPPSPVDNQHEVAYRPVESQQGHREGRSG